MDDEGLPGAVLPVKEIDQVLNEIGIGWWQWGMLIVLSAGLMADAMEVVLLSFLSPCVGVEWGLTQDETSALTSAVFLGELFGAFFWGPMADRHGRRPLYAASLVVILVFGLLSAFATSYWWLLVFRFLVGFGVGGSCVAFDLLAESVPYKKRGEFLSWTGIFWAFGTVGVTVLAWGILDRFGWRYLVAATALPVFFALIFLIFTPGSPRWLLANGHHEEAQRILVQAAKVNGRILEPFQFPNTYRLSTADVEVKEIFTWNLAWTSSLLTVSWFAFGLVYYSIILLTSFVFVEDTDEGVTRQACSFEYNKIFLATLSELISTFVVVGSVDRVGRVRTIEFFYLTGALSMMLLGFNFPSAFQMAMAGLARASASIFSGAIWIITPELYPTSIRSTAHAFFFSVARVGAMLSPFVVYSPVLTHQGVCVLIAIFCIVGVFVTIPLPETAGRVLDAKRPVLQASKVKNIIGSGVTEETKTQRLPPELSISAQAELDGPSFV